MYVLDMIVDGKLIKSEPIKTRLPAFKLANKFGMLKGIEVTVVDTKIGCTYDMGTVQSELIEAAQRKEARKAVSS